MSIMVKYLFFNLSTSEQFTTKYVIMLNSKANDSFKILVVIFKVKLSNDHFPITLIIKLSGQSQRLNKISKLLQKLFRQRP